MSYLNLKETLSLASTSRSIYNTITDCRGKKENFFLIENLNWEQHLLEKNSALALICSLSQDLYRGEDTRKQPMPLGYGLTYIRPMIVELQGSFLESLDAQVPKWQEVVQNTNLYFLSSIPFFEIPLFKPKICGVQLFLPEEMPLLPSFSFRRNLRSHVYLSLDNWLELENTDLQMQCLDRIQNIPGLYFLDLETVHHSFGVVESSFFDRLLSILENQKELQGFSYSGFSFSQEQFNQIVQTLSINAHKLHSFFAQNQIIAEIDDQLIQSFSKLKNLHSLSIFRTPLSTEKLLSTIRKEQMKHLCINYYHQESKNQEFVLEQMKFFLKDAFQIKTLFLGAPLSDQSPFFEDILKAYLYHPKVINFLSILTCSGGMLKAFHTVKAIPSLNDINFWIDCDILLFKPHFQDMFVKMFQNKKEIYLSLKITHPLLIPKLISLLPVEKFDAIDFFCSKLNENPDLMNRIKSSIWESMNLSYIHVLSINGQPAMFWN